MNERHDEYNGNGRSKNHRIGADLYNQDKQHRSENRKPAQKEWGEGYYFHTGPSSHGAQDRDRSDSDYRRGGSSNSSYNQGQNAHLNDHYGSRSNSTYRNERNIINHGDRHTSNYQQNRGNQGNPNDPSKYDRDEPWREHPGGGSRYKEDDYRYGSGSHNWYREGRYTHDDDNRNNHDNRGFFERVGSGIKNTWQDIMHSDDPDYRSHSQDKQRQSERISSRKRYGSEPYRTDNGYNGYDRSRDRGFEGGPRWADETDSGEDNYYNDTDRNQRYRR